MATVLALHIIWLGGLASVALGAECWRSYPQSGPNAYPDCRILSPEVALHWRDEGEGITFAMEVDGRYSWLGVGISEAGGMLAADMAVVRLNASSGAWAAGDYWSTGFERPRLDVSPQLAADVRAAEGGAAGGSSSGSSSAGSGGGRAAGQDVVLLSAGHLQVGVAAGGSDTNTNTTVTNVTNVATTTTTTMTTAEFWRPLDTCDPLQDMRILRGTTAYVIFAYGTAWAQHDPDHRGTAQLVLVPLLLPGDSDGAGGGQQQGLVAQRAAADNASPGPAPAPGPESTAAATTITATSGTDSSSGSSSNSSSSSGSSSNSSSSGSGTWEVRMQGLEVPPVPTSYLCRHFQVPNPDVKAHVTHWEVLVDAAVSRHVHHMIIYACSPAPSPPRQLYSCSGMDANCQAFYLLWAPGSTGGEAPPEAGYALGGDSGVTWVALQVHYTNPDQVSGLVDSSGFRLHTVWGGGPGGLRPHDMGVLALGSVTFALPPRTPDYSAPPNLCPAACTARLPGPLTLIWSGFHMHTLGKRMSTRWFRDGKELAPLGERRQYSFDYQGASYTDAASNQLLPGDELLTSCSWDSSGRPNVTTFGEATSDEMCFNFVSYYPRVPEIELCSTVLTAPTAPPPPPAGRSLPPPSPAPPRSSPSPSPSPSSSALSSLLGGLGSAPTASCTTVNRLRELTSALTALRRGRTSLLAVALLVASMQAKGELTDATPRTYAPYNPTCKPATFPRDTAAVTGPAASPAHTPAPPAPLVLLPVIDDSDQGGVGGGGGGASSPGAAAAPTHTASPELAAGGGGGSVYPNGTANVGGSDPPPPSRRSAPPPPRKRVAAAPPPRQAGGLVVASGAGAGAASGGGGGGAATSAAHAAPPPSRRGRSRRLDSAGRG